ncbi:putative Ras-related protein Rab-33 [Macrobrachium nipponense]|uniref:putative Ras-related protein Rab-33 n=1 Tax=Macrobrachium nipponense TaxID=159736 RepID=UPI0030C81FA1
MENYKVCRVRDANTMWICELPSAKSSPEHKKFKQFEKHLNAFFNKAFKGLPENVLSDETEEIVIVFHDGQYFRGKIENITNQKRNQIVQVFLLDYGTVLRTDLQLWDTAGQERFRRSMVQHYYRNVHAVVFVYDVTRMSSFQSLPLWIEECNMNSLSYNIPRILVGNKCDCKDQLAVPTNVAQRFADQHSMPLFETSAKDDCDCDHVEAIFLTLAHKLKASKPMMPIDPSQFLPEDLHRAEVVSIGRERNGMEVESSSSCYC